MQKSVLILILSALLLLTSILVAEVAQTINYQGQLTDTGGDPVANGVYSMTFNLYNDPASGAPIWSSLVRQVVVTDGLFSYTLGDSVALAYDLFSSDYGLWLGVKVGADPEMTPLTRLTAAPMAAVAASLNGDMKTSLGKLVLDDGRTGGGLDSTVVIASEASTLDHHGHVTILKIANGGADTTDLVGLFGDPDFARVEVGDGNDPDSGVVVQSAVDHKHHGHVTILKIANGGADTTDLVGLFGDPDFARVEVGDGNDPDSGVVVQSAVESKHHGHVTVLKIANGGADTTNLVGLFGDPDFASVEVGDGTDPDSGVVVQSAVERKNHGHVTVLKIANGGADTTNLVGLFGDPDFASVEVGDGNDPDSGVVVQCAVDHKHHGHVTILKIAGGGADTTEIVNISGGADSASIQLNGGGGAGGTILLEADESTSSGRIGVNTLSPAYEIDVVGTICATGGMCRQSDSRLKENVEPLSGAISLIQSLEPVRYNWRHEEYPDRRFPDGNQMGFIAQEVREVLPELVSQGSDGFYSLDYAKLTPILVGALKQQQQVIEGLQKQVAETRYTNEQMQGLQLQVNQMQTLIHTLMSDQQDSRESNADLTASR